MPNHEYISGRFSEISTLISDARNWGSLDPRLEAHLAAYVCVLLSGVIEDSIEHAISVRVGALGDPETETYVTKVVGQRFRNPDWRTINSLLGEFSDDYRRAWAMQFPSGSRVADTLQSIKGIKNSLAHTGSNSLHVTLRDVQHYLDDLLPAIKHFEFIVSPPSWHWRL